MCAASPATTNASAAPQQSTFFFVLSWQKFSSAFCGLCGLSWQIIPAVRRHHQFMFFFAPSWQNSSSFRHQS
jgi:hypothetical protein